MEDREQHQRERAYKIWEDEGRIDGSHEDHWKRAGEQGGVSEQEAAAVTHANQQASENFSDEKIDEPNAAADVRAP